MTEQRHCVPSRVHGEQSWFDRFADRTMGIVSNAPFFAACVGFILIWLAAGPVLHFSHHWVDFIHVPVLVMTWLMVALLQNEQRRSDQATQRKLNAIVDALSDLVDGAEVDGRHVGELKAAVGLEHRESTSMTGPRAARIAAARARRVSAGGRRRP